jgi:hypothetical protein
MASSVVLVIAFIQETYFLAAFSEFSRYGIYSSLAGISLHVAASLRVRTS